MVPRPSDTCAYQWMSAAAWQAVQGACFPSLFTASEADTPNQLVPGRARRHGRRAGQPDGVAGGAGAGRRHGRRHDGHRRAVVAGRGAVQRCGLLPVRRRMRCLPGRPWRCRQGPAAAVPPLCAPRGLRRSIHTCGMRRRTVPMAAGNARLRELVGRDMLRGAVAALGARGAAAAQPELLSLVREIVFQELPRASPFVADELAALPRMTPARLGALRAEVSSKRMTEKAQRNAIRRLLQSCGARAPPGAGGVLCCKLQSGLMHAPHARHPRHPAHCAAASSMQI